MLPRVRLILLGGLLAGCVPDTGTPRAPATQSVVPPVAVTPPPAATSFDPVETAQRVFRIEMYQFEVPAGSISGNDAFWKPANETFLGFNLHETLNKNGIRVGRVALADVQALLGELTDARVDQDLVIGPGGKKEIELGEPVPTQRIFWFDPRDAHLEGRSYERSQNLYIIAYRQLPRRPNQIQIEFAPAVRELRTQLQMRDGQVLLRPPDTIYAVGIRCELSQDECVVIAPSKVATDNSLVLGRAFLMEEGVAQRTERVLVIVPRVAGLLSDMQRPAAQ